jgi:hypothetical protein
MSRSQTRIRDVLRSAAAAKKLLERAKQSPRLDPEFAALATKLLTLQLNVIEMMCATVDGHQTGPRRRAPAKATLKKVRQLLSHHDDRLTRLELRGDAR